MDPDIKFTCGNCGKRQTQAADMAGEPVDCTWCGKQTVVPSPLSAIRKNNQTTAPQNKACPFCGEQILFVAKKCKHCGEFLEVGVLPSEAAPVESHPLPSESLTGKRSNGSLPENREDSPISFQCVNCHTQLECPATNAGGVCLCSKCGKQVMIPSPKQAEYSNQEHQKSKGLIALGTLLELIGFIAPLPLIPKCGLMALGALLLVTGMGKKFA